MDVEKIRKMLDDANEVADKTDFIVSWYAKKYKKTIRRIGTLNREGCRTWEDYKGNKLMCFWDTAIERYTTCINPVITYKRKLN